MPPRADHRAAPPRARSLVPPPVFIEEPEIADAGHAMAAAMTKLAKSIDRATDTLAPVAEFLGGAGERLDKLCHFLKTKGPWLLASIPGVLVAIGAVTPTAASKFNAVIAALTGAAGG